MGLITTISYCLSPVLTFKKADWIFLQYLTVGGFPCGTLTYSSSQEFTALSYSIFLIGFADWYMSKDTYIEKRGCCLTVWFYDLGEKWLGHDNPTFVYPVGSMFLEQNYLVMLLVIFIHLFWLPYGSGMLSSCVPFMV